jgi:hypothetical protein
MEVCVSAGGAYCGASPLVSSDNDCCQIADSAGTSYPNAKVGYLCVYADKTTLGCYATIEDANGSCNSPNNPIHISQGDTISFVQCTR